MTDHTEPHPCACARCALRTALEQRTERELRVTTFHRPESEEQPYVVMVSVDGGSIVVAYGDSEEVALYEVLQKLGFIH